jgi:branched-chain amino acid aminotransferase
MAKWKRKLIASYHPKPFYMKELFMAKNIHWDDLTFSLTPTDFMYISHCQENTSWKPGKLLPFGDIAISPAAGVLNYGQGIFEGLKAYGAKDGKRILLFRPEANAERIVEGCRRLCIPPVDKDIFMDAVMQVVKANRDYIPPYRQDKSSQGSLYLRPVVWGTGAILGVNPSPSYTFLVYASPVGPYFKGGLQPIKLLVTTEYHRAAPGGVGGVKAIGNYAAGLLPKHQAKDAGFQEVIYLDARENKYVEETGAANFFYIRGNTLYTAALNGSVLPGVTRRSILQLAADRVKLKIVEGSLAIDDVVQADEAFASGTAALISPIGLISYKGKEYPISQNKIGPATQKIYKLLVDIQHGVEHDPYGWTREVV